ncbi:MAG TPA: electron transfer flavoprotein subunit alpha/FixB family protein [Cryptosporangiaceae bacterium]|nr:electron transfer flavoprotein subunit alpha/FixB family protein [Cryptosporangiaceae bacterium]
MAEVLVLVEHADGAPKKVTYELLTAARALGEPSAVVTGPAGSADALADKLAGYGAAKIYAAESDDLDAYLVAPKVEVLAQLVQDTSPAAVLVAATAEGKEIAGRLAVALESGLLTDVVGLDADGTATQVIFAGAVIVKSKVEAGTPIYAVRGNTVPAEPAAGAGERIAVKVALSEHATKAKVLDRVVEAKGSRPELTEAQIVVSGGRGVGSAENFAMIEALADALGAAVGASRAATDSGFYPHQFQVGQTGKTVSPQLYVAVGISGAIQHRAGMQPSKRIVAVNKDAEAPIFELADFGVVGNLFQIVPQATEEIRKRKG